ncbi:MAG: amidohydrolase family protein [Pseudomonadota bacterium]|nr:amidohydrolase family protein [Pseudomonadota bacterium]
MSGLVLKGGLVACPLTAKVVPRDLVIRDGRIAGDHGTDLPQRDISGHMVIAGLINAHTHGHANLNKGVADLWPLEFSLTHGGWMAAGRDAQMVYDSTLLGAWDMLSSGVTAVYDLVVGMPAPEPEHLHAVARAYHDAGLRAVIAPMVADIGFADSIPGLADALPAGRAKALTGTPQDPQTLLRRIDEAMGFDLPEGIVWGLAPTIPHQCTPEFLQGAAALARARGWRLHMHVAESRLQAEVARALWNASPVDRLHELGILGPDFTVGHAVWLERRDFATLARYGATIAHVPASNQRLGAGVAPLRMMLEEGVTVALATDGANSSDAMNMFEAMRHATNLSRLWETPARRWVGAAQAYGMATLGGAAAMGLAPATLAPGAPADLVCLSLQSPAFCPLNAPITQMVTAENGASVAHVFVAGREVLHAGRPTGFDPDALRARIAGFMPRLEANRADIRALAETTVPHVRRFLDNRRRPDLGFTRNLPCE